MIKTEIIPAGFKQTSLGPIPSDWEVEELGSVVLEMKSGLSRELSNEDIGLPVIRSNNLIENEVDFTNVKYWYLNDNQGANTQNYYLNDGDILVNFINSVSQIGKCAYFKNLVNRPVIFTTNLLVVRFDMNKIDSRYFLYYSLQNHYNKFIESITKPAINQASFTTKDYKRLKLPLPAGGGIKKIFNFQRERFFPMPGYDLSGNKVKVAITGKVLDMEYARLLAKNRELTIEEIIMLDKVQKKQALTGFEEKYLKSKKLIEGRKPNFYIGIKIAQKTGQKATYTKNKAFDKSYYLDLIEKAIREHGSVDRNDVNDLLWKKLPDWMSDKQKKSKVNNLLSELRMKQKIKNDGTDSKPKWILIK